MFTQNFELRPDASDILLHPRIKISIKDQELNNLKEKLKMKEQELKMRENDLSRKEQVLLSMEARIDSQIKALSQKEKELEFRMHEMKINSNVYEEAGLKPTFRLPLPVTVGEQKESQSQRYF
ncbi:hypothetical protein HK103_001720 [Boothiomyces macroporosus]|uniref:Uncharacterized protein n=1 Tax=Boothiomyces macroporosus TaxID=261099 RepID=A0AAD5Y514_9FUNG|nr:hypothetical protein HK103_001720 [Boothiomyces macroporosus]